MANPRIDNHSTKLTVMGDGPFPCDICHQRCLTITELQTHMLLHSATNKLVCPICNKMFASATNMRNHLATHVDQKRFKCRYCDRRFNWRTQLTTHEYTHNGKGLYYCPLCSKPCMTKWLLTRHLKVHAKEQNVNVEELMKSNFQRKPASPDLPAYPTSDGSASPGQPEGGAMGPDAGSGAHRCSDCGETCASQEALATHLVAHLNSTTHVCKGCNKVYHKLAALRAHSRRNQECGVHNASGIENFVPSEVNFTADSARSSPTEPQSPTVVSVPPIVAVAPMPPAPFSIQALTAKPSAMTFLPPIAVGPMKSPSPDYAVLKEEPRQDTLQTTAMDFRTSPVAQVSYEESPSRKRSISGDTPMSYYNVTPLLDEPNKRLRLSPEVQTFQPTPTPQHEAIDLSFRSPVTIAHDIDAAAMTSVERSPISEESVPSAFQLQLLRALDAQYQTMMTQLKLHHEQQMAQQTSQIMQLQRQLADMKENNRITMAKLDERVTATEKGFHYTRMSSM